VTAAQLGPQYSRGSCVEIWGGTGASNALQLGDDAISNNTCYNDSGVTRTITAVKCRSDNGSNKTTINPSLGTKWHRYSNSERGYYLWEQLRVFGQRGSHDRKLDNWNWYRSGDGRNTDGERV